MFGDDFRDHVYSVTRYGAKNNPLGAGRAQFSNDAYVVARYNRGSSGVWAFNTMFPEP